MLTLLLGGARSGKSALAVEIGRRHEGSVVFLATAPPLVDADIDERIARHRAERPDWPTIEEPLDLAAALRSMRRRARRRRLPDLVGEQRDGRGDSDTEIEVVCGETPLRVQRDVAG